MFDIKRRIEAVKRWIENRKKNKAVNDAKGNVYKAWQKEWEADRKKEGIKNDKDSFYKLFCAGYEYSVKYTEANKKMNFFVKYLFVLTPIITCLIVAIGIMIGIKVEEAATEFLENIVKLDTDLINNFINGGKVVGVSLLIIYTASIVSKLNDIRKYQETWVRHSLHRHKLGIEMLKYIEGIKPYENRTSMGKLRTETFIEHIIELWNENEGIFVNNMTEKEKELMDMFDRWNVKKGSEED